MKKIFTWLDGFAVLIILLAKVISFIPALFSLLITIANIFGVIVKSTNKNFWVAFIVIIGAIIACGLLVNLIEYILILLLPGSEAYKQCAIQLKKQSGALDYHKQINQFLMLLFMFNLFFAQQVLWHGDGRNLQNTWVHFVGATPIAVSFCAMFPIGAQQKIRQTILDRWG